jgi:hypothetical protein
LSVRQRINIRVTYRFVEAQTDTVFGTHAVIDEAESKTPCEFMQLAVGERAIPGADSLCIRSAHDMIVDDVVDAAGYQLRRLVVPCQNGLAVPRGDVPELRQVAEADTSGTISHDGPGRGVELRDGGSLTGCDRWMPPFQEDRQSRVAPLGQDAELQLEFWSAESNRHLKDAMTGNERREDNRMSEEARKRRSKEKIHGLRNWEARGVRSERVLRQR